MAKTQKSGDSQYLKPSQRAKSPLNSGNSKTVDSMLKEDIDNRIIMEFLQSDADVVIADIVLKYFPNKTRNTAKVYGWRLVNDPKVRKRLGDRLSKRWNSAVLTLQERQMWLTDLILGEIEENADVKDKLKAIQILNDIEGVGKANNTINIQQNNLNLDETRKIVNQNVLKMLDGIQADIEEQQNVIDVEVEEQDG